jgi:hypothetical protein
VPHRAAASRYRDRSGTTTARSSRTRPSLCSDGRRPRRPAGDDAFAATTSGRRPFCAGEHGSPAPTTRARSTKRTQSRRPLGRRTNDPSCLGVSERTSRALRAKFVPLEQVDCRLFEQASTSRRAGRRRCATIWVASTRVGPRATKNREPRQDRKGATVSGALRVPRVTWPSSGFLFLGGTCKN